MGRRLEGKAIVITGAAGGLGRAMASLFAGEGARLVVADRDADGLSRTLEVARSAGGEVQAHADDLMQPSANEAMIDLALETYGRLDGLVTSAGVARFGAADAASLHDWELTLGHELTMSFLSCKYALRAMINGGSGSIVNVSSLSGIIGVPGHAAHATTKMGIVGLTRQLAVEYGPRAIRCNAIAPGPIRSRSPDDGSAGASMAEMVAGIPLGRFGTPEDASRAALFLVSEESAFITGQVLVVDGGASVA